MCLLSALEPSALGWRTENNQPFAQSHRRSHPCQHLGADKHHYNLSRKRTRLTKATFSCFLSLNETAKRKALRLQSLNFSCVVKFCDELEKTNGAKTGNGITKGYNGCELHLKIAIHLVNTAKIEYSQNFQLSISAIVQCTLLCKPDLVSYI